MIVCRSGEELERIHASCRIVAELLHDIEEMVRPGINTLELDHYAEKVILGRGARPAFKGYRGYPATLCTSLNEGVVHGIPSSRVVLKEGDILSIDVGVEKDGYYGDAATTVAVGAIAPETRRLLEVTRRALQLGIEKALIGNRVSDISVAVQHTAEINGFSVVRDFVGHGIGAALHEEPQVPNYGKLGTGALLQEGMVLAIEPMINAKGAAVKVLKDKWTVVTADRGNSAHFEHTIAVTRAGPWVLSRWDEQKKGM